MKTHIKQLFLLPALITVLGFIPAGRVTAQTFTILHTFNYGSDDGGFPQARLILLGNTLYGTTRNGGGTGLGTVFAVNTNGTGFTNLYNFSTIQTNSVGAYTNSDGAVPLSGLI